MNCPVCKTACLENSHFCSVCAWEFTIYVSDISAQEQELYSQKLQIAQKNWNELNKLKNKANIKEKQNQKTSSAKRIKTELNSYATPYVIKKTELQYSDKTAIPELNRNPFETFKEFESRINNYPPVPAGKVKLIKIKPNFQFGEFPIEINWEEWTQKIKGISSKNQNFCIHISPHIAEEFYQANEFHTLFVKLKLTNNQFALDCIELFWKDQVIPIDNYTGNPLEDELGNDCEYRMLSYNNLYVGKGILIKEKYDITTGTFPLELELDQWVKNHFMILINNPYIIANRDIASDIYEHSRVYPIKGILSLYRDNLSIEKLYLNAKNIDLNIENLKTVYFASMVDSTTQMEFIYVPGGSFLMGDFLGNGNDNEKPVHEVTLDGFYIGKYAVTQGQWKVIMNNNPSRFKKGDNYPVECVSWNDVQEFIKKINEIHEMNLDKIAYRLPTESEWEFAARSAGKKEKYAGSDNLDEVAWYSNNSSETTHPVGQKRPNDLGLYDMSGNVWEWCEDFYFDEAYRKHAKINPVYLENNSASRVLRGGAWHFGAGFCRTASRFCFEPSLRLSDVGFRLVFSISRRFKAWKQ